MKGADGKVLLTEVAPAAVRVHAVVRGMGIAFTLLDDEGVLWADATPARVSKKGDALQQGAAGSFEGDTQSFRAVLRELSGAKAPPAPPSPHLEADSESFTMM